MKMKSDVASYLRAGRPSMLLAGQVDCTGGGKSGSEPRNMSRGGFCLFTILNGVDGRNHGQYVCTMHGFSWPVFLSSYLVWNDNSLPRSSLEASLYVSGPRGPMALFLLTCSNHDNLMPFEKYFHLISYI